MFKCSVASQIERDHRSMLCVDERPGAFSPGLWLLTSLSDTLRVQGQIVHSICAQIHAVHQDACLYVHDSLRLLVGYYLRCTFYSLQLNSLCSSSFLALDVKSHLLLVEIVGIRVFCLSKVQICLRGRWAVLDGVSIKGTGSDFFFFSRCKYYNSICLWPEEFGVERILVFADQWLLHRQSLYTHLGGCEKVCKVRWWMV